MKLICQTKLQFREGNSDKVYEVDVCETGEKFVVNFRYGRRGAELKEGVKTITPVSLEEAEKIFQKLIDEKTRKGYHIVVEKAETAQKARVDFTKSFDNEERNRKIIEDLESAKAKS